MYTTYASSELYEFIIVIVISSNVVTRFLSPQLRCRLHMHKKLVAVDAKGVSAGAHISLLLHLSNPVTLTTNETLHTCILFVPVTAKMDVALSCYLRLDGWTGIARWVRYRVPLGRFRSEIQMKLLKTSKNSFKYGTGSVH